MYLFISLFCIYLPYYTFLVAVCTVRNIKKILMKILNEGIFIISWNRKWRKQSTFYEYRPNVLNYAHIFNE